MKPFWLIAFTFICIHASGINRTIVIENDGLMVTRDRFHALLLNTNTGANGCVTVNKFRSQGKENFVVPASDLDIIGEWIKQNMVEDTNSVKHYFGTIRISFWKECQ